MINIKLLTDNVGESWDRQIPLSRAEFLLFQMGDPEFEQFAKGKFHSSLIINFPDGTTMFFAEQAVGS